MLWLLLVNSFVFVARTEDLDDVRHIQCRKVMTAGSTQVRVSSVSPQGSWRHTLTSPVNQSSEKSVMGLNFLKCAQVEPEERLWHVRVMLVITNPAEGSDLSQLCIRDAVSDVTVLQTNGSVHERGYQTFSTDSLPAGSQYVVLYRLSLKEHTKQLLTLPAFLTFSNSTQNDVHLLGPVVANFTLRVINATHQDGAVLFLIFLASFLLMVVVLSVIVGIMNFIQRRRTHRSAQQRRRSFCEEAGQYEGICDIAESANQEAAFEDKFVDIMMLEDPQNMINAIDSLNTSTRLRSMVVVEHTRVQIYKGLLVVLLRGVGAAGSLSTQAERRVLGVIHGQMVGMEGKVQEEHVARMEALAARCNLETQEEMESQQRTHTSERSHIERLLQQTQQQDAAEVRVLLEKLHTKEKCCLQRRLMARHEHASAQAQRQQALRRRFELHKIFGEELQEATRTGELQENTANQLLLQYYGCQDRLEEVLDVLLANQRALLTERHAQRRLLVQSFENIQTVTHDFSSTRQECGVLQQCSEMDSEVSRMKQDLLDSVSRKCRAIRCDIIKRRRQLLSEMVCKHRRQLQDLCDVSQITVTQYLQEWTKLLLNQSTELSELILQLDKQTVDCIQQETLDVLRDQLKARVTAVCPGATRFLLQADILQEKLQSLREADVLDLQSTRSCIQKIRLQELQHQKNIRHKFREYCSYVCGSQRSLSHEHWLRVQLECVKAACCLDHCLVLQRDDPAVTSEMQRRSEVMELKHLHRCLQQRMQLLQRTETENDTLQREWSEACVFQQEQFCVCQERVAAFVAALHWEHAEKTAKVTETHSALLKLQTLITQELHNSTDITHIIHTHCLALEKAELQLQEDEVVWEKSVEGQSSCKDDDDDVFEVNSESRISDLVQEALYKRQHLTQRLTDSVLRRNQTMEYEKDQIELKRLNTYCQQDLELSSVLVSLAQITVPDLHEILRLLLPTVPEGELLSLIDALQPKTGADSGACVSLADRLRCDVLRGNLSHLPHHRDRERDRLVKKRQKLRVKLFSGVSSSEDVSDLQQTIRPDQITDDIKGVMSNKDVTLKEDHISTDRLFIFRSSSPVLHEHTQTRHTRRKKRNYLNFKKNTVAPAQNCL